MKNIYVSLGTNEGDTLLNVHQKWAPCTSANNTCTVGTFYL